MAAASRAEELVQYRPKLVRFAQSRLLNSSHAEDAVEDSLLAAIESIGTFSGNPSLYSWLTGILKHKIVDCVRRSVRDKWHEMDIDGTPLDADGLDFEQSDHWAAAAARGDPEMALDRCIRELPARTAETFFLRAVMGLDTAGNLRGACGVGDELRRHAASGARPDSRNIWQRRRSQSIAVRNCPPRTS